MSKEKTKYLKALNDAFGDFKFFPEDHHYEYKGERVGISVTKFYAQYENEFKQEEVAEKIALKNKKNYDYAKNQLDYYYPDTVESYEELKEMLNLPITIQQVLDEWEYKNKFACEKGSAIHNFTQALWNGAELSPMQFCSIEWRGVQDMCAIIDKIAPQSLNFYKDYENKLEHIADEFVIGSNEYDIASCVDDLFVNKLTGGLVMVDYKTNTDIYKNDKYAKKMKPPLDHLKDTTLNHYALQVSIYKFLIETYTDLKVDEMFIVWFSENNENYEILEVPYLKKEVKEILEWRKWE